MSKMRVRQKQDQYIFGASLHYKHTTDVGNNFNIFLCTFKHKTVCKLSRHQSPNTKTFIFHSKILLEKKICIYLPDNIDFMFLNQLFMYLLTFMAAYRTVYAMKTTRVCGYQCSYK